MKSIKYFILVLSVLFGIASQNVSYAYNADGNPNEKREIDGAMASVPYREYQLVRFAENNLVGVQLTAGDVVVRDCVSDDGVTVGLAGTVGSTDAVVGVVVSPTIKTCDITGSTVITDFGRRNWGYIQVKGYCATVNITGGPAIAGGTIIASATPRFATADYANAGTVDSSKGRSMGFAYDASVTAVGEAEIDL